MMDEIWQAEETWWTMGAAGKEDTDSDDGDNAVRGLDFGDDVDEPGLTEFFCCSLTIGMTFRTSDVSLRATCAG